MEKLNIAELLKDCPKGMELNCTMYDNVQFDTVQDGNVYPIKINTPEGRISLSKYGCYSLNPQCKCVIFPKGKTTWDGFQRPFKDGDVIVSEKGDIHLLSTLDSSYCAFRESWVNKLDSSVTTGVHVVRFATEEEKHKLFDAIKENGYKWNAETKTLEKLIEPKFKVGDKIVNRNSISVSWIVSSVNYEYYGLKLPNGRESIGVLPISEQDNWELVPNKFDITTLKPFESRVLVRSINDDIWRPAIYGFTDPGRYCVVGGIYWEQCIPYLNNEHLCGTTNDCDDFYKTWE